MKLGTRREVECREEEMHQRRRGKKGSHTTGLCKWSGGGMTQSKLVSKGRVNLREWGDLVWGYGGGDMRPRR